MPDDGSSELRSRLTSWCATRRRRRLTVVLAVLVTGGVGAAVAGPLQVRPARIGSLTATFAYVSTWPTGYTAHYKIHNSGTTTVTGWTLTFQLPSNETVTSAWNGILSVSGSTVKLTGYHWDASISPGSTITPGFEGAHSGTAWGTLSNCLINGASCSGSLSGTSPTATATATLSPTLAPTAAPTSTATPVPITTATAAPTATPTRTPASTPTSGSGSYDQTVLGDGPVAFWDMSHPGSSEPDVSGHGNTGTYKGGTPTLVSMPDGSQAADFNGSSEYLTVPSNSSFSIPTKGYLTWEGWIRPDVLQFPNDGGSGYVDWMGKCQNYSPTCEWESRIYDQNNSQSRTSRLSAYVFNPSAGYGSAADWQPNSEIFSRGRWIYVVGEYQIVSQPSGCNGRQIGGINIWVDGVEWDMADHLQTGCMSQYGITPKAGSSPLNIGTMAFDTWFKGAVGKVAIYDHLLSSSQISNHFTAMTGLKPGGSCGNKCI